MECVYSFTPRPPVSSEHQALPNLGPDWTCWRHKSSADKQTKNRWASRL